MSQHQELSTLTSLPVKNKNRNLNNSPFHTICIQLGGTKRENCNTIHRESIDYS